MKSSAPRLLSCLFVVIATSSALSPHAEAGTGADTWTTGSGTTLMNASGNWTGVNAPPISGDSWTFGTTTGTTSLTDNLTTGTGWQVNGITFNAGATAANYVINPNSSSNSFTLTNTITDNNVSGSETINDGFALNAARIVTGANGSNMVLGGAITGAYTLSDTSTGTVTFSNANSTFSGGTTETVDGLTYTASVIDNAAGVLAVGASSNSPLTQGPLGTGVLYILNGGTTLEATGGAQSLNNNILLGNVGMIIGGNNALTLNGQVIFGGGATITDNNSALTTIAGGIQIRNNSGVTRTAAFAGSGNLVISGVIENGATSGEQAGNVSYAGTGTLTLSGLNTYTGTTSVTQGTLGIGSNAPSGSSGALGSSTSVLSIGVTGTAATPGIAILTTAAVTVGRGIQEQFASGSTPATDVQSNAFLTIGTNFAGLSTYSGPLQLASTNTLTAGSGGEADFTGAITNYYGYPLVNLLLTGGGVIKLTGGANNLFGGTGSTITVQNSTVLNLGSSASNTASLGSSTNTLVLNGGTLQFSSTYDPTGSSRTVTLGNSGGTIDTNGFNITVAGVLANATSTGSLTLNDSSTGTPGSLTLSGNNTFSGGTTITNGTLITGGTGTALGSTSAPLAIGANGNLNLNSTSQAVGNLTGSGTIYNNTSGTGTLTVGTGNTGSGSFAGVIKDNTGSGGQVALSKVGTGTIALSGANTYTGGTSVTAGTLSLGATGSLGGTTVSLSGGSLLVGSTAGATATTIRGANASLSVSSGGSLVFANGASLASSNGLETLTITNSTAGATALTLSGGTISIGVGSTSDEILLGNTGVASVTGATTINLNLISALNGTMQQLIAWGSGTSASSSSFTIGKISGTGQGNYTLSLSATSAGLFLLESSVSTAYWTGARDSVWSTNLPNSGTSNFSTDAGGTTNRTAALDGSTSVTFNATGGANYANTTLGADTTINSLTYNVGGVGIGGGNTLTISSSSNGITVNPGLGAITETISSNVALGATQTWNVSDAASTLLVSGNIGGSTNGLNKVGSGTLTLTGDNTYSGATMVLDGYLNIQSADALDGTSSVTVSSGAALQLAGAGFSTTSDTPLTLNGTGPAGHGALQNLSGDNMYNGTITLASAASIDSHSGLLTLNAANLVTNGYTLTLTGAGNGLIYSNIASGSLIMAGTGTWTIDGGITADTGSTTINSGTLQLGDQVYGYLPTGTIAVNGGTLDLNGVNYTAGNITGTGGTITNNGATPAYLQFGGAANSTIASSITDGTGGLTLYKQGAGVTTLTGVNAYTGATSISGGALNIGNNSALGTAAASTSNVTVGMGAALQIGGTTGGIITTTPVGLSLVGIGINGNGALENVIGNNSYTGAITLTGATYIGSDAGTLTLPISATIGGSGALTLVGLGNGVIASVIGSGVTSLTVNSSGTWTPAAANTTGTWTLSGANAYSGATLVTNGTLAFASGSALPSTSTLTLGSTTNNTTAALNYTGSGETIANALSFTGSQTIALGNSGTGAVIYTATPTIGTGTKTLALGNTTDTLGGSIGNITDGAGKTSLIKTGATNSTWILTGTNSYTGSTTIKGGVLQVASASALPTGNLVLSGAVSNSILQTQGTLNLTLGTNLTWGGTTVGGGGFSAIGGTLNLNINNGAQLSWGTGFIGNGGAILAFGSSTSNAQVILPNAINLNTTDGFQQSVYVAKGAGGDSTLLSGVISGGTTPYVAGGAAGSASGLTKAGAGTLILSNANNSYTGYTSIESGTLVAEASSGITAANTTQTSTGVFGNGYGNYGTGTATAGFTTIYVGTNQGGGTAIGGVTNPTLLIGSLTVGGSNSISNGVAISWNNAAATNQVFGIGGYSDANGTFSGLITLNGAANTGNTFAVTQVATTGTDALNITGGITATIGGNINFANVGAVNVGIAGTSAAATASAISNGAASVSVTQTGPGTTTFLAGNTYTGGTTISAGKLYANNAGGSTIVLTPTGATPQTVTATNPSSSATGTGAVLVGAGGTLAGSGTIGGAVTVQSGGALSSGAAQVNAQKTFGGTGVDTVAGTGLTLTSTLNLNAGSTLTFALGAGASTGAQAYGTPNMSSTYLSLTGTAANGVNFGIGSAITIKLVDLTAFSTSDSLQFQNAYLLMAAGANTDYANLVTTGGVDQNGQVLGIGTSSTSLTALNVGIYNINGNLLTEYPGVQLYLNNGDLEAVVPEPSTWALMLGGLALLILVQRRRRAQR